MQSQVIPILMIQSLPQITDVLDPGRERDFCIEHSVLYPKNYLFVCLVLSDLKSHRSVVYGPPSSVIPVV